MIVRCCACIVLVLCVYCRVLVLFICRDIFYTQRLFHTYSEETHAPKFRQILRNSKREGSFALPEVPEHPSPCPKPTPSYSYVLALLGYYPSWRSISPVDLQSVHMYDGEWFLPAVPYYHSPSVQYFHNERRPGQRE